MFYQKFLESLCIFFFHTQSPLACKMSPTTYQQYWYKVSTILIVSNIDTFIVIFNVFEWCSICVAVE